MGGYSYCIESGMIQTLIRFGLIGQAHYYWQLAPSQGILCSPASTGKYSKFYCRPGLPSIAAANSQKNCRKLIRVGLGGMPRNRCIL